MLSTKSAFMTDSKSNPVCAKVRDGCAQVRGAGSPFLNLFAFIKMKVILTG